MEEALFPSTVSMEVVTTPSRRRGQERAQTDKRPKYDMDHDYTASDGEGPSTSNGELKRKRQSPEEVKQGVLDMVTGLGSAFKQLMAQKGLVDNTELRLIQNSHGIERVILAATDDKRTKYLRTRTTEGQDPDKTGATLFKAVKKGDALIFEAMKCTFNKDDVKALMKRNLGTNYYNALNHIMVGHSNMNDVCFQRTKALKAVGLEASLVSTFSGSTIPRRAGATGNAVKGGGTLVAEAIRFIKRSQKDRNMMRDKATRAAFERVLLNLKRKCSSKAQQGLVQQVMNAKTPGEAELDDLKLLARSFLLVRPSVATKAVLPIGAYLSAHENGGLSPRGYSLVGHEAYKAFNAAQMGTLLRRGDNPDDKCQMYLMSCFGFAFEDLRILNALTGVMFKPRSALKARGFHIPVKEQGEIAGSTAMDIKFNHWAPLTVSGGNDGGSREGDGQLSLQPCVAVERPIAINKTGIAKLLTGDPQGRMADNREAVLNLMTNAMSAKCSIGFKGKGVYEMNDEDKTMPISVTLAGGVPSFFFGRDCAEDYDDACLSM
uniref:Nucleoprotein n=1 Tax=Salamander influenza-like virus TaxID=2777034 RepID=A0A866VZW6_9ORTO|nr:nucleoprotein [Salamander influenza-like virus]